MSFLARDEDSELLKLLALTTKQFVEVVFPSYVLVPVS